eukprot:1351507-Amphidinium_carterae.1
MDPFSALSLPLRQPWETGWGAALCSSPPVPDVVTASALLEVNNRSFFVASGPPLLTSVSSPATGLETARSSVAPAMAESNVEERKALLDCLLRWLLATPSWSQLGQQLLEHPQDVARLSVVADAFADRATGTLRMRVNSLKQLECWRGHAVPFDEKVCYEYVDHLRQIGAPPTRAKTFVGS